MTISVSFDGIDAEYLITSGVSERMRLSNYQPGGDRFTDAEALRWAACNLLNVSTKMDKGVEIRNDVITIYIDTELLEAKVLANLLQTEITHGGRTYAFEGIRADAETYMDYGGEGLDRWMELSFKAKA